MIGRLVSGRYRIEAVVGTGGMAVVYRALDLQQNRIVAIKVLRPKYESDMEFVRRFSREAEAAAKMSHENIVNLLDVGIDGDMRYIVMEYVDGRTLKEMIREEGRIHPDVALRMTIRILAAVDHAHRNGIVHRDIKPQNILVDKRGQVKVADFGIARLKASQTTKIEQNGSAMGSVHYLSPEQAQGEVADEQSDLYSVGIVLYEMLTGHVPFDGDTTVSVALKHVSEEPKSMRSENPQISRALDEVVMRALCKDKERRYQTAAEMAADLRKTISHPRGGFVRYPKGRERAPEPPARREEKRRRAPQPRKRHLRAYLVAGAVGALCVLAIVGMYLRSIRGTIPMPNLLGRPEAEAVSEVRALGIEDVNVVSAYSEDYDQGEIMLQSRAAGDMLRADARVILTVSLGSQWDYLENMSGWQLEDAIAYLEGAGVKAVNLDYDQSELPVGTVISQDVPEGWTSRDAALTVKISGQSVSVPSLSGLTLEGARAVIEAEGLKLGNVIEGDSADARSGTVIGQSIAPYTQALAGTSVDLTVCRAQNKAYAPEVPLTLVAPLNGLEVRVDLRTPSGQTVQALSEVMDSGVHQIELSSAERGRHAVEIYLDGRLFESLQLDFE